METIIMQIKQIEHDRVVFASYSENKIIGINFHQGCDQVDWSFKNPCPILSKILEMFLENENLKTEEDKINKAIELYCNFFIFQDIEPPSHIKQIYSLVNSSAREQINTTKYI